ncbi:succinate dehydrogenase cytochrome b subunit [Chamaesiphon sp. GL140_3_metabinner_50]|uniref:succinate dehydrogenase cytochrome b subunit n=1 Tax=Chamaesiphon sp. GL140_3_metabinner_50 TaxID=2970812 RepID=UPI0025E41972|nr:succinate dehydrogenase cytochrome b subunit [Chamaesiphon sp. GL140_3_metabinner_50]
MKLATPHTSSISRKVIMAGTGLFLTLFLIVHLGLNATILANDGGGLFDRTADLLRHNWGLHGLEILVWGGFIVHIWQGASLTLGNQSKRSTPYAVSAGTSFDPARWMGLLGAIVLAFLILHLYQFWLPNLLGTAAADLSAQMQSTMNQWWVVIIYGLGCLAVAAHLVHGWRSAMVTLGIADRYRQWLTVAGTILAIVVPLGLAAIPIALFTSHAPL